MAFDKHIPFPSAAKSGPHVIAPRFREMEVGDSVFSPHEGSITRCKAYMRAKTIEKRKTGGFKFVGRSVVENGVVGVRIWRTE